MFEAIERFDETFVHNFYGYLSSVTMAGKMPNPLQMLRFLDHADGESLNRQINSYNCATDTWHNSNLGRHTFWTRSLG